MMNRRLLLELLLGLAVLTVAASGGLCAPNLTFLQLSDVHYPHAAAQSRATIASIPQGPVHLTPGDVTVPAPSFALVSGDLTEFGGGSGWWDGYTKLWSGLSIPIYNELGNHDNTWDCGRPRIRAEQGGAFYAFERAGVKFIGWDTASPQDPRPSIATEALLWLKAELAKTPPEQPVMLFLHHPLDGREFASSYDRARLLDLLQTRNVALLMVGHGHNARAWKIAGIDTVMGGSTWGGKRGFNIVSIKDNVLRVCYQNLTGDSAQELLLEKPLPTRSPFLPVGEIVPQDGSVLAPHEPLRWDVQAGRTPNSTTGKWVLDDDASGDMRRWGNTWTAQLSRDGLALGAHRLRFEWTEAGGPVTSRTVCFWLNGGPCTIAWKSQLSGSCQSTPTLADGRLYVGANDGCLYAFDAASGDLLWRVITAGEVRSQPIVDGETGLIYFGSADGGLYAVRADGTRAWRTDSGAPIYGSPLVADGRLLVCNNDGDIAALDKTTGAVIWRSTEPEYAIETQPCVGNGLVFAGCWDRFIYALDAATGELKWKTPSRGSEKPGGAARYYSPGDCGPAFAEGKLFVADRAYYLSVLDAASGERLMDEVRCAGVASSADGRFVYVRHSNGRVSKRRPDGSVVWTAKVPTGAIAAPPTIAKGRVLVVSNLGTLSVLDDKDGRIIAQYKAFPSLYAFASAAFDGERIYVADMGGHLLALELDAK